MWRTVYFPAQFRVELGEPGPPVGSGQDGGHQCSRGCHTRLVPCLMCVAWTPAPASPRPAPPLHAPQDLNTMQHSKSELVAYGNRTFTATYHVSPGRVGGVRGHVQDKETVEEWPVAMRDMLDPAHDFSSTAHHISQWYVWRASPHSSHLTPTPHPSSQPMHKRIWNYYIQTFSLVS